MSLSGVLDRQVIVCAGSGGVGKTTISAAIALEAARRGRKTIVVTIDPAKRLADAMGLDELSTDPRTIALEKFIESGLEPVTLDAMMLDTKTTFDQLVTTYARDEGTAKKIIDNRFYKAVSGALSGTHEYMAMEKLYELAIASDYDVIVIDTPPTRNALDFLEAPKNLTSFLEGRLLRWFLLPAVGSGKGLFKVMNIAAVQFLRIVRRVVGAQILDDTAEFLANFEGMYDGFKQRAQAVYDLLQRETTAFVVVTAATDAAVDEALFFSSALNSHSLPFGGLVVNRVLPHFDFPAGVVGDEDETLGVLHQVADDFARVAVRRERSLRRLEAEVPQKKWVRVPFLTSEVADLRALSEVAGFLFAEDK